MAASKSTTQRKTQTSEKKSFTPFTTEQKKEYGKQFSAKERSSYHKGRQNAYQHSANMAGRQAKFIRESE